MSAEEYGISQKLVVNARAAGPRLGKSVQQAIKGTKTGDWSVAEDGTVTAGGLELQEGEYSLETVVDPEKAEGAAAAVLPGGGFVVLDTQLTPELEAEGLARDTIRMIAQARRDADLHISDRIVTTITARPEDAEALTANAALIQRETLSDELVFAEGTGAQPVVSVERTAGESK